MNNLDKKTKRLHDDATIYQKRELKSEKTKLSEMNIKEKLSYFKTYYAVKTFFTLLILLGVSLTLYSMLKPKVKPVLYVVAINSSIDNDLVTKLEEEISGLLDIDDMEKVIIDNTFYIQNNEEGLETSDTAINQVKLTTFIAAREIDLIIAPEGVFSQYVKSDFFINLEEQLPNDIFVSLSEQLYFGKVGVDYDDDPNFNETKPYGIMLDNLSYYENTDFPDGEKRILGIVANSPHKDNSISFIRHVFEK